MSGFEEIIFDGGSGQCERFIRLVRKAAFSQGKLEDAKWVAMFASTCLEGKALRWYSALDPATKLDWHLLEPALLARFSDEVPDADVTESRENIAPETSIPTPAAAPPPPSSTEELTPSRVHSSVLRQTPFASGTSSSLPKEQGDLAPDVAAEPGSSESVPPTIAQRGRIRVIDETSGQIFYLRQSLNWFGEYKLTSKTQDAASFTWDPTDAPGHLTLVKPIKEYRWIGLTWSNVSRGASGVLGKGSKHYAEVVALGGTAGKLSTSSNSLGASEAAIWVLHSDMTVEAQLPGDDGVIYPLEVLIGTGTGWIWLVSDLEKTSIRNAGRNKARLVFEPI